MVMRKKLVAGNWISIKGVPYKIASVTNDATLPLTADYAGTTAAGITVSRAGANPPTRAEVDARLG